MLHKCKMIIFPDFFHFLIFYVVKRVKRQKPYIPQEPYLIWLWFLVHMCKMMLSPAIYFIFLKFLFFGCVGGESKGKNDSWLTISVCHTLYLRNSWCALGYQPPSKAPPPLSCQTPLKLANCPSPPPLYRQSPPLYWFSMSPPL